ncbi:MAG: hypothetical protein V3S48_06820 [Candidatus Neomarinimicrobiota bacterium]
MPDYRRSKGHFKKLSSFFTAILLITSLSCDFQNPTSFKLPTWFFDLSFPLVQKTYSLQGMVDNKQIFPTSDSLGMQLVFEGELPDTSISSDILNIVLNQEIDYSQDPVSSPELTITMDTTINISIPLAPAGLLDENNLPFSIPSDEDKTITASTWNTIAAAFDTTIQINLSLPEIPEDELPDFITSVDAYIIIPDDVTDSSLFSTTLINNGLPTAVVDIDFKLSTDFITPAKVLANHTESSLLKDDIFAPEPTALGGDSLGNGIRMEIGFGIASTTAATLTINSGDSVQVNLAIRLKITGIDSAVVQISETELPISLPEIAFPGELELYEGILESGTGFGVNEIIISNLSSTYPFDLDFGLNFSNFIPPAGADSIKLDTTLSDGLPSISKTFDLDGYSFSNPEGADSVLTEMTIEISAGLEAQTANIPLDGGDFGAISISIQIDELAFESLEANIIQEFPTTEISIDGMPMGFSGFIFSDVKLEIEMLSSIRLPVVLDFDIVAVNQMGDSAVVAALSTLASPVQAGDTAKTIVRLSREGTTTLKFKAPGSILYTDSSTAGPVDGESTIVDLMSFNPKSIEIRSRARIDGRGTIEAGATIGGKFRMISPFEIIMEPLTFLSVTNTPIAEMDAGTRNRIRNTLQSASLTGTVENKIPSGGEISILLSDKTFFPLDTTAAALSMYRDSMVVKEGWSSTDSIYIISQCDSLDPALGIIFIFEVMDDYADCINGLTYLVKSSGSIMDTVISYVDTLLKIPLPDPVSFYSTNTATAHAGSVREPGFAAYSSDISPDRIILITDPGDHFTAPRFHLNGSGGKSVFLSLSDYIDINSTIIFRLSSTGMMDEAPDELALIMPNGGETLLKTSETTIKWKTYGSIAEIDIHYSAGTDPDLTNEDDWTEITAGSANVDSFSWVPSSTAGINSLSAALSDSIRIRIKDSNSSVSDMSGWYFTLSSSGAKLLSQKKRTQFLADQEK